MEPSLVMGIWTSVLSRNTAAHHDSPPVLLAHSSFGSLIAFVVSRYSFEWNVSLLLCCLPRGNLAASTA